jgi:hypothetical protein
MLKFSLEARMYIYNREKVGYVGLLVRARKRFEKGGQVGKYVDLIPTCITSRNWTKCN